METERLELKYQNFKHIGYVCHAKPLHTQDMPKFLPHSACKQF